LDLLPVVRIGGDPIHDANDHGILSANRATCQPEPVVFVCNLADVEGRSLASLFDDPTIRRETFDDMAALAEVWQPD
jgi:hypothetical protein